jgi:hypothetical protein
MSREQEAKKLVCPVQSIGLEMFHPEIVSLSGPIVEECHPAERKYLAEPPQILQLSVYHTTQVEG